MSVLLEIQTNAREFASFLLITISVCILAMQDECARCTSIYFQTNFLLDSDEFPLFYMVLMFAPSNWKYRGHRKKANGLATFIPPSRILWFLFNHIPYISLQWCGHTFDTNVRSGNHLKTFTGDNALGWLTCTKRRCGKHRWEASATVIPAIHGTSFYSLSRENNTAYHKYDSVFIYDTLL
jgi:hypothetical protein